MSICLGAICSFNKGHSIRALKTPRFKRGVLYNLHSSVANACYTSAQNAAFETLARNAE
jgi:hypothetical protein